MYAKGLNKRESSLKNKGGLGTRRFLHILRSPEHAAMFWPVGSNLQLKISPFITCRSNKYITWRQVVKYTECAPARLTIGASRLLVLWTVRISPLFRSSFVEDMAIWLLGGGVALALLTSAPPADGDSDRLDIFSGRGTQTSLVSGKRRSCSTLQLNENLLNSIRAKKNLHTHKHCL